MNGSTRRRIILGILLIVAAGIYTWILFLIKKTFSVGNWICYGGVLLGFVLLFVDTWIPSRKYKEFSMFGLSITKSVATFFAVEFIVFGIILMALTFIDWKIVTILQLILLLVLGINLGILLTHKSVVEENDIGISKKTQYINDLHNDLYSVASFVPPEYIREFKRLCEDIEVSDPMSSSQLQLEEERLKLEIMELCESIKNKDYSDLHGKLQHASQTLRNRNQHCKTSK